MKIPKHSLAYLQLVSAIVGVAFTTFSVSGVLIAGYALLVFSIISWIGRKDWTVFKTHWDLTVLVLYLLIVSGVYYRGERELFFWGKFFGHAVFLFFVTDAVELSDRWFRRVLLAMVVVADVLCLRVAGSVIFNENYGLPVSFLPGLQETAGVVFFFFTFQIVALLYVPLHGEEKKYLFVSTVFKGVTIALLKSRTYFFALVLVSLYAAFLALRDRSRRVRALTVGAIILVALAAAVFYPGMDTKLANVFNLHFESNAQRICAWKRSLQAFVRSPLTGHGIGYFSDEFFDGIQRVPGCGPPLWNYYGSTKMHDPHNLFLYFLVAGGVPALFLYLVFVCRTVLLLLRLANTEGIENLRKWWPTASLLFFIAVVFLGGSFDRHPFLDPLMAFLTGVALAGSRALATQLKSGQKRTR